MKKRYQQPQMVIVNIETSTPIQTSGVLPSNIPGPGISNGIGSSRRGRDYWDDEDENWDED